MLYLISLTSGILFGIGLAVSNMISPSKIVGFLDITGDWDPSLAFVMVGAVIVTGIAFKIILKRSKPIYQSEFNISKNTHIDLRLILGASIFGVGWAISGLCPGPAIASIGFLNEKLLVFVIALLIGSLIGKRIIVD